jgi:Putative Flp pilus-assembly TadE/G-like
MKAPAIRRFRFIQPERYSERGLTMILVAVAMVAIIAMAALSIDVVTLYLAKEEAQRSADAGALAAARVISISGVTGTAGPDNDSGSWQKICGPDDGTNGLATRVAKAVAGGNAVGRISPTVSVTYSSGSGSGVADCTAVVGDDQLGVNPLVTVQVTRNSLPTFFSRIWSRAANTVSATATAEVFNPSNSGAFAPGGDAVPVTPLCVKPWIIPNKDPVNGGRFINASTGAIQSVGIRVNGAGTGIVGESFLLTDNCTGSDCSPGEMLNSPPNAGRYVPAYVTAAANAVPACANESNYQKAIGGCDVSTVYACGTINGSHADLSINPGGASGDTSEAAQCLIRQTAGQDTLDVTAFPYRIRAGSGNPVINSGGQVISASNSIVTVPIYDDSAVTLTGSQPQVTILGFLQVFIDSVNSNGNLNVHVLNIAGCGNDVSTTLSAPGTSPVPIRLITPH